MLKNLLIATSLLVPLLAFLLAIQCLYQAPKSKVALLWFFKSIFVGIIGLGIFLGFFAENVNQALLFSYILFAGASLMPAIYLHFVTAYLSWGKNSKSLIIVGYILAGIFFFITFYPPLLINSVSIKATGTYWANPGQFFYLFLLYFWVFILYSIFLLIKSYRKSEGIEKTKIFYLIIAAIIGFGGGGTGFLPQVFGIYPYGYFITFLYPIILSYGIFLKKY